VTRIGAMFQLAGMRASSSFPDTTSVLPAKLGAFFERIVVASEAAMNVLPALLTPSAVVALVLGLWRVSSDLGWTEEFLIGSGFFSHWQVWIALSVALQLASSTLSTRISSQNKIPEEN
jgi:hypothetical protein